MSNQESLKEGNPIEQQMEDTEAFPLYFPVSPLKLVVMSICTIGIYDLYWFYKNWALVKEREKLDIMPFWRAFFAYFFCYSLFKKIQDSTDKVSLGKSISPGPMAAGWIIVTLLWKLPDPYWLITYFSVFFLVPVQYVVNELNDVVAPTHNRNIKFTGWNIVGVVFGGLIVILGVVGIFLSPE